MAELTNDELASLAGFTVSFYKHNSELWSLFKKAQSGDWDGARLLAATRNTKWFKQHSEAQRQAAVLKTSDPAEYNRRLKETRARVVAIARQTGLGIYTSGAKTTRAMNAVRDLAFVHQWTDEQIKNKLAAYNSALGRVSSDKFHTTGLLGEGERTARRLSRDYGINVSNNTLAAMARNFALGRTNSAKLQDYFLSKAKSTYAGIADQLEGGLTVRQAAEPYIDSMARLWEINANDINTNDSTIRKALTSRDKKGKPIVQPVWQFEDSLRKDQRWKATNNGREAIFNSGHKVLRDLGLLT